MSASPNATALAAMTCSSGPPCVPGNTDLSMSLASSAIDRMSPARGPRSVLCVVLVTTCACGTGDGYRPDGDQAGEVRHVHQELGADLVGDGAEGGEVDDAGIGAAAGDEQRGPFAQRQVAHLVVVDAAGGRIDAVVHRLPDAAAVVDRGAVRQVPAMRQRHAHELAARRQEHHERREIGLRARVRLHVGVRRAEQLLQPVDGQLLHLVHHLAAAVVPLARVPLGVLVGERRAHRVDDGAAREVLARDELEAVLLPAQFLVDQARDDGIGIPEWGVVVKHSAWAPVRSSRCAGRGGPPRREC